MARYIYKVDEITDIIRSYCDAKDNGLFNACNIVDDYYFDIRSGKINSISKIEYEKNFSKAFALCHSYLERGDIGNHDRKELISDFVNFLDVVSELEESKKFVHKSIKESKYKQGDLQKGDILKTNGYGIVYFVGDGSEFTDDSGEMFWGSGNEDDFENELGGYYYYSSVVKVIGNVYEDEDEDEDW